MDEMNIGTKGGLTDIPNKSTRLGSASNGSTSGVQRKVGNMQSGSTDGRESFDQQGVKGNPKNPN